MKRVGAAALRKTHVSSAPFLGALPLRPPALRRSSPYPSQHLLFPLQNLFLSCVSLLPRPDLPRQLSLGHRATGRNAYLFIMPPSTLPKIAAASIPSITTLRNELDYGDPNLPRCAAFYDDTRAFRKKFRNSRGTAGVDLHDWKSREGQADLTEMTIAYLEKEGNGQLFWPDDRASPNYNRFQYAKDGAR